MRYTKLFSYLLYFGLAIVLLIGLARQTTLVAKHTKAVSKQINSTVEIHVERAYDKDMAQYGYKMIAILPEKEAKP